MGLFRLSGLSRFYGFFGYIDDLVCGWNRAPLCGTGIECFALEVKLRISLGSGLRYCNFALLNLVDFVFLVCLVYDDVVENCHFSFDSVRRKALGARGKHEPSYR